MAKSEKYTCKSYQEYFKKIKFYHDKLCAGERTYENYKAYVAYNINYYKWEIEGCVAANPAKQYVFDGMAAKHKERLAEWEAKMVEVEEKYGPKNLFSYMS